jgi:hypothetical protein
VNSVPKSSDTRTTPTGSGPDESQNHILCPACGRVSLLPVARDVLRARVWVLACDCGAVFELEAIA